MSERSSSAPAMHVSAQLCALGAFFAILLPRSGATTSFCLADDSTFPLAGQPARGAQFAKPPVTLSCLAPSTDPKNFIAKL